MRYRSLPFSPLFAMYEGSVADLARETGNHFRTVQRWSEQDQIGIFYADRVAVALGLHPALVWGDEWWDIANARPDV